MTIQQFIDKLGGNEKFDQIYVVDREGKDTTAYGDQEFYKAEIDNCKYIDVTFTI